MVVFTETAGAFAWGSLADFLNVAAAIAVGVAVWLLSRRTFDLQHSIEVERSRVATEERDLMLIFLAAELTNIRSSFVCASELLPDIPLEDLILEPAWNRFIQFLTHARAPLIHEDRHRLHMLDNPTAARVARLAGFCWTLEQGLGTPLSPSQAEKLRESLSIALPKLLRDLDAVFAEVSAARDRAGLVTPTEEGEQE